MLPQEHEEKEFLRVKSVKRKAELRDEGKTSDPKLSSSIQRSRSCVLVFTIFNHKGSLTLQIR